MNFQRFAATDRGLAPCLDRIEEIDDERLVGLIGKRHRIGAAALGLATVEAFGPAITIEHRQRFRLEHGSPLLAGQFNLFRKSGERHRGCIDGGVPRISVKEARQAIGYAIDYDGIINSLLGGAAVRPANFLPIGVSGSTEEIAKQIGFRQDLDKAKSLLQKAGLAEGFEFDIAYGNAAIAGVTYQTLAQKIQADLARVNIRAKLTPMDQVNLRTTYTGNKAQGGVLTFWNPPAVENLLWAAATVERVAKRVHWTVPDDVTRLVHSAAGEQDPKKQAELWVEYQKRVVDQANYIILFQPVYQIAVRNTLDKLPLTAAGWQIDMYDTKPKSS